MFWKIILMHIKYIYTYQILCYNLQLIFFNIFGFRIYLRNLNLCIYTDFPYSFLITLEFPIL